MHWTQCIQRKPPNTIENQPTCTLARKGRHFSLGIAQVLPRPTQASVSNITIYNQIYGNIYTCVCVLEQSCLRFFPNKHCLKQANAKAPKGSERNIFLVKDPTGRRPSPAKSSLQWVPTHSHLSHSRQTALAVARRAARRRDTEVAARRPPRSRSRRAADEAFSHHKPPPRNSQRLGEVKIIMIDS